MSIGCLRILLKVDKQKAAMFFFTKISFSVSIFVCMFYPVSFISGPPTAIWIQKGIE